jgi:hypothetical protein
MPNISSPCFFIERDKVGHRLVYGNPSISITSHENRNTYYNMYLNSWSYSKTDATIIKHWGNAKFIEEFISSLV